MNSLVFSADENHVASLLACEGETDTRDGLPEFLA